MTFAADPTRRCISRSLAQSESRGHASASIANLDPDQTWGAGRLGAWGGWDAERTKNDRIS